MEKIVSPEISNMEAKMMGGSDLDPVEASSGAEGVGCGQLKNMLSTLWSLYLLTQMELLVGLTAISVGV